MIPVKHIDPDDLPLYAMQLLPPDEMEEMRLNLEHSGEARRVLAEVYSDLSILAHSIEMHAPPATTRQRLMKHVMLEKKEVPAEHLPVPAPTYTPRTKPSLIEEVPPRRNVAARLLPWAGWAIAAGMAFAAGNLYQQRERLEGAVASDHTRLTAELADAQAKARVSAELAGTVLDTVRDPAAVHVTLTSSDKRPPPQGRASYIAEKGSLIFLASNLPPIAPDKIYELWLIPTDGRDPIAAGTFRPDQHGDASVVLPKLPSGVRAKAFGVTIEDGEGSSIPTMPIVLKGVAG